MSAIDNDKRLIFIHVPKTGGTSMESNNRLGRVETRHYGIDHYAKLVNLDDYFKFAFVRNPYDRLASAIVNHVLNGQRVTKKVFAETLARHKNMLGKWIATKPQHTFICLDGKIAVDIVGRFENLEEDWTKICKKTGVIPSLGHEKRSDHSPAFYKGIYNKESKAIVSRVYKKDFILFDYQK